MSDAAVNAALEALEAWLSDPERLVEPEFLAAWHRQFQAAQASAERGPQWPGLVARAHALAEQVDQRRRAAEDRRTEAGRELDRQAQGLRALQGYRNGLR